MKYSTYFGGRYYSSKASRYSTCRSRKYGSKYCVDNPVCEPKGCGTGYQWNEETQVGNTVYAPPPCPVPALRPARAAHVQHHLPTCLPQDRTGGASSPCVTCMLVHSPAKGL
jgi:hypothetical protein